MATTHTNRSDLGETNPSLDVATRVSAEAAQKFIDSYYRALDTKRETISFFYAPPTAPDPQNPHVLVDRCDITLNGNNIATPQAVQQLYIDKIPESHHEIQSFDAHFLNLNYNTGLQPAAFAPKKDGSKMSIVVMVSGYVEYGGLNAVKKGFSETLVLIPNSDTKGKVDKRWVIVSQQFRIV